MWRVLVFALLPGCASSGPISSAPPFIAGTPSTLREVRVPACCPLGWPVEAQVSSGFGVREGKPHLGVDLVVPVGTPVLAACDGIVRHADETLRGYGRMVLVEHGDGLVTAYAHNERLLVAVGQAVTRGQPLALSGQTGRVTAPHVHFEVRVGGHAVDPLSFLEPRVHITTR